jgi:hypothetical protein
VSKFKSSLLDLLFKENEDDEDEDEDDVFDILLLTSDPNDVPA